MSNNQDPSPRPALSAHQEIYNNIRVASPLRYGLGVLGVAAGVTLGGAYGAHSGSPLEIAELSSLAAATAVVAVSGLHRAHATSRAKQPVVNLRTDNAVDWEKLRQSGLYRKDATSELHTVKGLSPVSMGVTSSTVHALAAGGPALLTLSARGIDVLQKTGLEAADSKVQLLTGIAATGAAGLHFVTEHSRMSWHARRAVKEAAKADNVRRAELKRIGSQNRPWRHRR